VIFVFFSINSRINTLVRRLIFLLQKFSILLLDRLSSVSACQKIFYLSGKPGYVREFDRSWGSVVDWLRENVSSFSGKACDL